MLRTDILRFHSRALRDISSASVALFRCKFEVARLGEGIDVKPIVALHANFKDAVGLGVGYTKQHITLHTLTLVQRRAVRLPNLAFKHFRRTRDAPAITATDRQHMASRLHNVDNCLTLTHFKGKIAAVFQRDLVFSQLR